MIKFNSLFFIVSIIVIFEVIVDVKEAICSYERVNKNYNINKENIISNADKEYYIKKIEDFFNRTKLFTAEFLQIDRSGEQNFGYFFIKNRKLKLEYISPPSKSLIIKEGKIILYDKILKEKTESSAYSSPLSFLLKPRIDLHNNLKVLDIKDSSDRISITFCKKDDENDGAITISFSKNPFILVGWEMFISKRFINTYNSTKIILSHQNLRKKITDEEFDEYD